MVMNFLTKIFGSKNERELKKIQPIVDQINSLEPTVQAMDDVQLAQQTIRFNIAAEKIPPVVWHRFICR